MSTAPPLPPHSKICLLICDPTREEFIDSYGNITNLFTGLYTKLLLRLTKEPPSLLPINPANSFRVQPYDVIRGNLPDIKDIDQFDSILVSGSAYGVNDDQEWIPKLAELLNKTATEHPKVKLMGVCFGHQIICHAVFGLPVKANPEGWEIGPYTIDLNETGKKLFEGHNDLAIEMFHHDAVFTSAQLAYFDRLVKARPYDSSLPLNEHKIWASSPKTGNQGVIAMNREAARSGRLNVDDIHVFTVQGHPELTQGMTSYLLDLFEHEIDPPSVKEARQRIADFKGTLDWYQISLLMWALTTNHSVALPQLHESIRYYKASTLRTRANEFLEEDGNVFVLVL